MDQIRIHARWAGKTNRPAQLIEQPVVSVHLDAILFSLSVAGRVVISLQFRSTTDHHYRSRVGPNVNEAQPPIGLEGSSGMQILAQPVSPIADL